ncbi:MAG: trypsin-like peptidase domain-containing protein [Phycisphaerales bacterium JB063]
MNRLRWYGPSILLLLTVVLAMAVGPSVVRKIARAQERQHVEQVRQGLVDNPTLATMSDAFKDVATVVRPSLTSITVYYRDSHNRERNSSNGSGWVYRHYPDPADPDTYRDYIITNHHVARDILPGAMGEPAKANRLVVRFADGGDYYATVVGTDPQTDIAVLEIDREDMIPAVIAADTAKQGEIVFAFGSPFQFDFSMSQGVVSATGRQLGGLGARSDSYEDYIQTDAAINPGNSGGPLTNVRGEVVGMNTAIATELNPAATFSGLGFAIPADMIVNTVEQLIAHGEVRRGYLGVYIHNIDSRTANELGLEGTGVLCSPAPGSPAEVAGIELGDVITHIEDTAITNSEKLRIEISRHAPGSAVDVRLLRFGIEKHVRVELVERPGLASSRYVPGQWNSPLRTPLSKLGLDGLEDYTPGEAEARNWAYTHGALIRMIRPRSTAQNAGLDRMMVISHVNGVPINQAQNLADWIDPLSPGDAVDLTLKEWDNTADRFRTFEVELVVP